MNIIKTLSAVILIGAGIYAGIQVLPLIYPPLSWVPTYLTEKVTWLYQTVIATPLGIVFSAIGAGASIFKLKSNELTVVKTRAQQTLNSVVGQANNIQNDLALQLEQITGEKNSLIGQLKATQENFENYKDSITDIATKNTELFTENKRLQEALSQAEIKLLEFKNTLLEQKTPTLA